MDDTQNFEDSSAAASTVAAPDITNTQVNPEEMPDLSSFARPVSEGAWPAGWYQAKVIEGYATGSGFQWVTGDLPSKDNQSRNMTVCFSVTNSSGDERKTWTSFNYRSDDFTKQKLGAITELRQKNAKLKQWPEKDLQRTSIAVASLGQFERAFAGMTRLKRTTQGNLATVNLIGYKMDLRLSINDDGFNEVEEFAPLGEKTGPKKGKS